MGRPSGNPTAAAASVFADPVGSSSGMPPLPSAVGVGGGGGGVGDVDDLLGLGELEVSAGGGPRRGGLGSEGATGLGGGGGRGDEAGVEKLDTVALGSRPPLWQQRVRPVERKRAREAPGVVVNVVGCVEHDALLRPLMLEFRMPRRRAALLILGGISTVRVTQSELGTNSSWCRLVPPSLSKACLPPQHSMSASPVWGRAAFSRVSGRVACPRLPRFVLHRPAPPRGLYSVLLYFSLAPLTYPPTRV